MRGKSGSNKVFKMVGGLKPGKSAFDLSYQKLLTCDMGQLIPVLCDECVPGDIWEIANTAVAKFQPLVAPIMHQVDMAVHYFFVPYRLLWTDWENFITGGEDGDDASVLPRWTPGDPSEYEKGTLWDYLGFPVDVYPTDREPMDFPRRAYYAIWNDYYRDENVQDSLDITDQDNYEILNRAWEKDYFTSSLPEQQRGTAPAFPIVGTSSAVWSDATFEQSAVGTALLTPIGASSPVVRANDANARVNIRDAFNDNTVDLSLATPLDIADMRLGYQTQKWLERNNRAGARYIEFLRAHFNEWPRDDRLQRPEYIGGSKSPIVVSEVLQTSETDSTPQANRSGNAVGVTQKFIAKYRVKEFGLIMGIMSIMPKPVYQQGINRQWLRESKYDFYFPEFANLSEQAIEQVELYATAVGAENTTIFGYQGQYDEMRVKQSMVVADFRDTFDYWHISRQFSSAPILNESFIVCDPRKDIFAVQDEPGILVQFMNIIKAIRPLPFIATPGYIDHN